MYGTNMGSLYLQIKYNNTNTWQNVWSKSGNQGNSNWYQQVVNLPNSSTYFNIRFRGITGSGFRSDMAIDDIYYGCDISLQTPEVSPTKINHLNGVPIQLTTLGNIKYTLDKSDPTTSSTANIYTTPFNILKSNNNYYQEVTLKSVSYLSNKYSDVKTITYNITNGYGNSKIDFNEDCDDGNRINNDGCSSVGKLEIGFNCCQDINGRDSCQTIENSLPYHFSNSLNNQVVDQIW